MLRKTTRGILKMLGADEEQPEKLEALKPMMSGVGAEGAKLLTLKPAATKALRFTFNTELRKQRLENGLEDLTDDEAEEEEEEEDAEASHKEGSGVAASGGMDEDEEDAVETAGVHHAADKPLHKRQMSSRTAEWIARDEAGIRPGLYESDPVLTNPKRDISHRKGKKRRGVKVPDDGRYHFWNDGS